MSRVELQRKGAPNITEIWEEGGKADYFGAVLTEVKLAVLKRGGKYFKWAEILGLSQADIVRLEAGQRGVTPEETLMQLAQAFSLPQHEADALFWAADATRSEAPGKSTDFFRFDPKTVSLLDSGLLRKQTNLIEKYKQIGSSQ